MKRVSIITPVYNAERYIVECVQSVINQTYPCIELILTDDHGGDRSIEMAKEMLSKVNKEGFSYRIIDYGCNKGVSIARNEAMKVAMGDYIFFLDSDDKLFSDCIEKLVMKAEETGAEVVMCDHVYETGRDNFGGSLQAPKDYIYTNEECLKAFAENWFGLAPWCKLFVAQFIHDNGLYFEPGIINEDAPWIFQFCLKAKTIAFLNEKLYFYRYNNNSIMSKSLKEDIVKSNEIALSIFFREASIYPQLWDKINLYKICMRQTIMFYTLCYKLIGLKEIFIRAKLLPNYKFESIYYSVNCKEIPTYYRLWNIAFLIPYILRPFYMFLLIFLQSKK